MPDYFTTAELRALPSMGDTSKFPDTRIDAAAAYVVGIIEREVGTSFVARERVDVLDGSATVDLPLKHPYVVTVTRVEIDGAALAGYTFRARRGGLLRRYATGQTSPDTWPAGFDNIEVTYQAGYSSSPPADVKEAALKATRAHLLSTTATTSIDDRRTSLTTEAGTVGFVVAGEDRPTGYPDVDVVIVGWRDKLKTFGFG